MLHPTRNNLLLLKEKLTSVRNSIGILKSRRQALIQEFLKTSVPYLESRRQLRILYGEGITQLGLCLGYEGPDSLRSICRATRRVFQVIITSRTLWGLEYKEIDLSTSPVRPADRRNYDYQATSSTVEESCWRFEKIAEAILQTAAHDNKLKRLSSEISKSTRRMRILEERTLVTLDHEIKFIEQYITERDRESHYRLKRFKQTAGSLLQHSNIA